MLTIAEYLTNPEIEFNKEIELGLIIDLAREIYLVDMAITPSQSGLYLNAAKEFFETAKTFAENHRAAYQVELNKMNIDQEGLTVALNELMDELHEDIRKKQKAANNKEESIKD